MDATAGKPALQAERQLTQRSAAGNVVDLRENAYVQPSRIRDRRLFFA